MKKLIVVLILLLVFAGTVMGQADLSQFPDPIEPGNFLLSVGAGLGGMSYNINIPGYGSFSASSFTIGGLVKFDWALPIPLTVGIETGLVIATGFKTDYGTGGGGVLIPALARVGWHPNFGVSGLDPYIAAKGGIGIFSGGSEGLSDNGFCIGFGGDIGARYFFTPAFGAFLEGDFDVFIPTQDTGEAKVSLFAPSVVVGITFKF